MNTDRILQFLSALRENNSVAWMHENKAAYNKAKEEFTALVQELLLRLSAFEPGLERQNAKELLSRLNRDTRFGADKTPYNTAFSAHLSAHGRAPIPVGYYLHLAPGGTFLGGGLFTPMFADATQRVRAAIDARPQEFRAILETPSFQEHFTLCGESLKNVPREYAKDHPMAEYLKMKSWYVEYPVPDGVVADVPRFLATAEEKFRAMQPMNMFLNSALEGFQMPQRG